MTPDGDVYDEDFDDYASMKTMDSAGGAYPKGVNEEVAFERSFLIATS